MIRRVLLLVAAFIFVFLAIDIVYGFVSFPADTPNILIAVGVPTSSEMEKFAESGVPAFASLTGQDGDYLIAGASNNGLNRLQSLGLDYRVLDEELREKTFYIASPTPNKPAPHWNDYGELLLDDGALVLLRMSDSQTEGLSKLGVRLQKLALNPIVLSSRGAGSRLATDIDPDPIIQSMIDQVNETTLKKYTGNLSGEWPVIIGGQPYTIITRHTNSGEPIEKATEYVTDYMEDRGLVIEHHVWNADKPPNVIGEITGEIDPDDIFLITAHIDDMPAGPVAPGADDNASGSAGVMIASDIFSQYRWGCTLRFAFFTGEEQGLDGSTAYAQRANEKDENIEGVLNMDMLGYNTPGSSRDIGLEYAGSITESEQIAFLFGDVIDAYSIDLVPGYENVTCCSDHVSFLREGFPAILVIEDFSDFNPNYHSTGDLLANLDMGYFTDLAKASIGTFAHMTDCMITGSLDGHVQNAKDSSAIVSATITYEGSAGLQGSTTTNSSGYYTITNSIETYTLTASAPGYIPVSIGSVEIISGTTTTVDFDLQRFILTGYLPMILTLD